MSTQRYAFHGVGLEVAAEDPAITAAVDGRLRHFRANADVPADVRFVYRAGSQGRPEGDGRPVYDPVAGGDVRYFEDRDALWIDARTATALCHPGAGAATVAHGADPDLWLLSRPLLTLPLIEALERRGLHCLHAAGVAVEGRAVLFAGPSGAGKSTLAVALACGGLPLLADDMVFLSADAETVHGFPDEIDVTEKTASWFPELGDRLTRRAGPWPKHRLRIEDVPGASIADDCAPGLLLLPEVSTAERSRIEALTPGEALVAVAPNVLLTEPASTQAHLDALAALVRASRCHRLVVGRDFAALPDLVRELVLN